MILQIKDVNITYKTAHENVYAVKNANFSIDERDGLGIVGESGSGKSTLAMGILRLLPKNASIDGEILYKGVDLLKLDKKEMDAMRWKDIAVVFQKSMNSLSPVHKIGVQLEDVYKLHTDERDQVKIKQHIVDTLELVNLPTRVYNSYPYELSGGMMQRVSIALSLINDSKLLIFDEATTALDVVVQKQILNEIMDLEEKLDITRIMITHDISVVAATCNKVIVMKNGEIVEAGLVEDVLLNPQHEYTKELLDSFLDLEENNIWNI